MHFWHFAHQKRTATHQQSRRDFIRHLPQSQMLALMQNYFTTLGNGGERNYRKNSWNAENQQTMSDTPLQSGPQSSIWDFIQQADDETMRKTKIPKPRIMGITKRLKR